MLETKEATNL